jgi:hypothetical protein
VNVRQVVVLVVDQVQPDDDAVEHGNDGHVVLLEVWLTFSEFRRGACLSQKTAPVGRRKPWSVPYCPFCI